MTRKDQYFLALVPPEPLRSELSSLKEYFRTRYKTKGALNSPPHITLHMPFEWREDRAEYLVSELRSFAASEKKFEIHLSNFGSFEPRVIFIRVPGSDPLLHLEDKLYRFCKTQLGVFNARYQDRPFHPHLTVAFRDLKKEFFQKAWEEFSQKEFSATFDATGLFLLKHNGREWEVSEELPFGS